LKKPPGQGSWPGSDNPPGKEILVQRAGSGRTEVFLELRAQGRDFLLLIGGGQTHVGAVAVVSAGAAEVIVVPGHKEGPLASRCARKVALASGRTCAAVGGIHQDQATREEIEAIVANVEQALQQLLARAFPHIQENQEE
jgi:hypothetical protein